MRTKPALCLLLLGLSIAFVGCKEGGGDASKSTGPRLYDVRGKVVAMNPTKPAVTLDHEDIPGLMKAMQMEFGVEDSKLLKGIKAGDQVQGQLKRSESGYVVTRIEKR